MKIIAVAPRSQAEREGLLPGDDVTAINGGPARDAIDLMYYGAEEEMLLTVKRDGHDYEVVLDGDADLGIEFEAMDVRCCGNQCLFCFVDQNPPGMRPAIYIKDEDYRYSFLHGAYTTLTNLGTRDIARIIEQRLSPLYISVHATDPVVRTRLLGLSKSDGLMDKLRRLTEAGIRIHTQAVICPGINDGAVLERTVTDLRELSEHVLSLAVVPVGLTSHRAQLPCLAPVDTITARTVAALVNRFHDEYSATDGSGFVYCADEWYLRGGLPIPEDDYYDDFPQLENGVGMVRQFMDDTAALDDRLAGTDPVPGRYVLVTGMSMAEIIGDFALRLSGIPGITARSVAVTNRFYGETVTVSGLLTGGDIRDALSGAEPGATVVLPPNCLNADGRFLDDLTPADLERSLGMPVIQAGDDPISFLLG